MAPTPTTPTTYMQCRTSPEHGKGIVKCLAWFIRFVFKMILHLLKKKIRYVPTSDSQYLVDNVLMLLSALTSALSVGDFTVTWCPHLAPTLKDPREMAILWTSTVSYQTDRFLPVFLLLVTWTGSRPLEITTGRTLQDYKGSYTKYICHVSLCKLSPWQGSFYKGIKKVSL